MADTAKWGAVIAGQVIRKALPFVLTACGGFVAASWPVYHAAFCGVQ